LLATLDRIAADIPPPAWHVTASSLEPLPVLAFHLTVLTLLGVGAWRLYRATRRHTLSHAGDQQIKAVGNLVASVAHEIRNPLNTVALTCRYLERVLARADLEAPLRDDVNRNFEIVSSEIARLTDTLDGFMLLSEPTDVHPVSVDIDTLVDETLTQLRRELDEAHVSVERTRPGTARAAADPKLLSQVFAHIIRNAIDAMPDGGTLSVATTDTGGQARVSFADTGTGIAAKHLAEVFEPHFSTKSSGLGLGLALSRKAVTAHGGALVATSRPGSGATLTVILPSEVAHA